MKNQLNFKDIAINSKSKSGKEIGKIMASMELDVAYLISRHEKAIKILEGIQTFKSLKKLKQDSL